MAIIKTEQSTKFNPRYSNTIPSREINRKFGKKEDFVELHIYDLNGKRLQSFHNFEKYQYPNNSSGELVEELIFDYEEVLERAGYRSGIYDVHVSIQRRKIFDVKRKTFRIKEISSSRTELKVITTRSNEQLDIRSAQFIKDVQDSPLFRDFNLNFGKNVNILGINIDIDRTDPEQYAILVKLFKPLPRDINVDDAFNFTEELIAPVITTVDLGQPKPIDTSRPLRGPNFRIDTRLNGSIPTAYKSYDDILSTSTTSSYQKLLSRLDSYEVPEVDYSYIRPQESSSVELGENAPSHFENFVHFGSATERLKNFEYKVKLIEEYNRELKQVRTITGDTSQSAAILTVTSSIELKKENLIQGFDGYERFLYFESGAFSWPKTEGTGNETSPYLLAPSTSEETLNWIGSAVPESPYYGGQLNSASIFDNTNQNSLIQVIPAHVGDKIDNEPYLLFCNMIGNFFDPIWTHMKEITQIRDNSHIYGVSKDLVYYALKSLGIEAHDQFENQDLVNYIFGEEYNTTDIATVITGSASSSLSRGDITKEVWKRLYHNAPYLLKSKGTARGLQALISCYGIPNTILNVKEYMGSNPIREDKNLFEHNKYQKALNADSEDYQGFFVETEWSSSNAAALSASRKTVEFRINPHRYTSAADSGSQYHLFSLSGSVSSSDLHLVLSPWSGSTDFYDDQDRHNFGRLDLFQFTSSIATSSYFPVYNGRFWNVFIGTDGITGSNPTVSFGAYQANHLKEVDFVTSSVSITEKQNAEAFGNAYYAGEDIVTNGAFSADSNFTKATGWTIAGGVAAYNNLGTAGNLTQTISNLEANATYEIAFDPVDIRNGSGSVPNEGSRIALNLGGAGFEFIDIPSGSKDRIKHQITSGIANTDLEFRATTAFTGSIDNLTLKKQETYHSHGAKQTFFGGIKNLEIGGVTQTSNYFLNYDSVPANTSSLFDLNYSGSLSEVRIYFGELLSHNTLKDHALDPLMYAGNATTSSYETLITRFPLSFELEKTVDNQESILPSSSFAWNQLPTASLDQSQAFLDANAPITGGAILDQTGNVNLVGGEPIFTVAGTPLLQSHHPNEGTSYLNGFTYMNANQLSGFEETHFQLAPNTVGRAAANNKIRIDSGSVKDGILSTTVLSQTPTTERQPNDFEDVGVFFSPQNELNEDIIYTLGHFSMDDNIGDPRHQTSSIYPDLSNLKTNYFQKIPSGQGRLNTFDFIRLIQFTDHTLFELIKQFTPQKANLKTGLLIEPHYLERNKFPRYHPEVQHNFSPTSSLYEAHLKDIDKELTGSFIKNNNVSQLDNTTGSAVVSHTSLKYPNKELIQNPDFKGLAYVDRIGRTGTVGTGTATGDNDDNTTVNGWGFRDHRFHGTHLPANLGDEKIPVPNDFHYSANGWSTNNGPTIDATSGSLTFTAGNQSANVNQSSFLGGGYKANQRYIFDIRGTGKVAVRLGNGTASHFLSQQLFGAQMWTAESDMELPFRKVFTISQGDIEKYEADGNPISKFQLYGASDDSTAEVFHASLKEFDDKEVFSNPGFRIEWDALTPNNWTINAQQNVSKVLELNKEYRLSFEMKTSKGQDVDLDSGDGYGVLARISTGNSVIAITKSPYQSVDQGILSNTNDDGMWADQNNFIKYEEDFKATYISNDLYDPEVHPVDGPGLNGSVRLYFWGINFEPGDFFEIRNISLTEKGRPQDVRGKNQNLNATIIVDDTFDGVNTWEQGPINPKTHFQLDFSDKPDGYNIDNGKIGGLSTTYGVAGDSRTIEQNRLKLVKPQGQINNGAVTRDFGVNVGKQYIFSCDTTENPGNLALYQGSTKNDTDEALTGGYATNPNRTGSLATRKNVNLDAPANTITGTSTTANETVSGSIRFEFGATEPFQRIYFRANNNSGDAGTTFFSNIKVVEKNLNERVSSGSNELRPHALTPYGNYMNSTISKKVSKNLFGNRGKELLADPTLETGNDWNVSNSGGTTPGDGTGTYTFDDDGSYSQLSTGAGIIELGKTYELTITVDSISAGTKILLNQTDFHKATPPGETGTFTTLFTGTTQDGTTTPRTNLVLYHHPYNGVTNGAVISFVSLKEVNPLEKVEFDDSLLDLAGWKRSRYDGSRLTGAKINEYAEGDITYGKNPVIDKESTNLYFCTKITAGENEDDKLCKIKNHSYITINSIISIDEETDSIEIIDKDSVSYNSFQNFLSNDLYEGAPFSLKLLDPGAPSQLKKTYYSKFHQGYLYRTVEHKGEDGNGSIYNEGIQAGRIDSASSTFPSAYFSSSGINVFNYGSYNNTINTATVEVVSNNLTREIWPIEDSFGLVNFDTSSQDYYYDTMENLSSFYNSMLIPIASESKKDLYVTFNKGQRLAMADYEVSGSLAGIQSISTAQLDLENHIVTSSNHTQITASSAMKGFGKDLVESHHYMIPIMQGPHDLIMNKKAGANITWPGTSGILHGSNEGTKYKLKFYFSGHNRHKALYQISYVEEAPVIIANVVKTEDLTNGIGEKGFIIIPDNLNKDIKKNIDFYLGKTGLMEESDMKKAPKQGK